MKQRIYWIRWKLMDAVMMAYIKIHRIGMKIGRKWAERKGSKTTWSDVFRRLDKTRRHDNTYFNRLGRWSKKVDKYWLAYMDLKYK